MSAKPRFFIFILIAILIGITTGCTSIPLDRRNIPSTEVRTVTITMSQPSDFSFPHNEIGLVLAVAKTIVESEMTEEINQKELIRLSNSINQELFDVLQYDLDFQLIQPISKRHNIELDPSRQEWVQSTRYRYEQQEHASLNINVDFSYSRAPLGEFGEDDINIGVSFVYPLVEISLVLTSINGETLWRDSITYQSNQTIPYGDLNLFGVSIYNDFEKVESFAPFFQQALSRLVHQVYSYEIE